MHPPHTIQRVYADLFGCHNESEFLQKTAVNTLTTVILQCVSMEYYIYIYIYIYILHN